MRAASDLALASTLRIAVMRLSRRLRQERVDESLSLSQLAALATLEHHGPMTPGELAAHEKVQPPSMTRILGSLEDRGLVQRQPHPSDGRQVLVTISAEGRALILEDRRRRDAWLTRRLQELPGDDLQVIREAAAILDRLAQS